MNLVSKFQEDPMVKESMIVSLLEQVWVSAGKEKATMRRAFLSPQILFSKFQRLEYL